MMKMAGRGEERSALIGGIVVPAYEAERGSSRAVGIGEQSFYSRSEMSAREALAYGRSDREELPEPAPQTGQVL
jgi:hypothetical protein